MDAWISNRRSEVKEMTTPQVKTGLTHLGTAVGGAVAATAFLAQHQVDLYAIWNQLNDVIAAIGKLIALLTPIATGAYGVYRSSTSVRMTEALADPKAVQIAESMPVTPQTAAVAEALKKE